ncbi:MAG: outer membrane beta-barrel protein [Cyclobacteriaceae bacterium]|nr:outer membrane beta-barrel protein [Cyclobacteriaceae bacterium]MCX7636234.1 outer membrane beta-barrel protein [Cyclobacteriaceae bacterium]
MKKLTLLILLMACLSTWAQKRNTPTKYKNARMANAEFLEKQWWLGLKTGTTLAGAVAEKAYSGLSPVNYDVPSKVYDNYSEAGFTASLEAAFSFLQFTIVLQPGYRSARYSYTTDYLWTDYSNPDNRLELTYLQRQRVEYADFPLLLRYDFTTTRLRPYIQAGAYYTLLIQATKSLQSSGTDYASGGVNQFSNPAVSVGATDLFAPRHWGLLGGLGVNYQAGNVRFTLDIQYRKGMSLANSTENRFANTRLSSFGDAMDDIKINSALITLGALFPMKFLSKSFQSMNTR